MFSYIESQFIPDDINRNDQNYPNMYAMYYSQNIQNDQNNLNQLLNNINAPVLNSTEEKLEDIYEDIIGNNMKMKGPISDPHLINADVSTGLGLYKIENFIQKIVLPSCGAPNPELCHYAVQTSHLVNESKKKLRKYCNALGDYSIIYSEKAISKLIDTINIRHYVTFYSELESLANIYNSLFTNSLCLNEQQKMQFQIMTQNLRMKVDYHFKQLFYQFNYFIKPFSDKNSYKCFICNQIFEKEIYYKNHQFSNEHMINMEKFWKIEQRNELKFCENEQIYFSFLDSIRKTYRIDPSPIQWNKYKTDYKIIDKKVEYIYRLIKDYKRFRPIVFLSLYEDNNTKLSWLETGAHVVTVSDIDELNVYLSTIYKNSFIKFGSFTAASNITGYLQDVDALSILMHKNDGLAFFDYTTAAPCIQIDCKEKLSEEYRQKLGFKKLFFEEDEIRKYCYKDALFFSPHKFIGGPNTPEVLIVHNRLSSNRLKCAHGNSDTVFYVLNNENNALDIDKKEESETPNIIGRIRIGLMIDVYSKLDYLYIAKKNSEYCDMMNRTFGVTSICKWNQTICSPNIYFLDQKRIEKNNHHIPIFSFLISYGDKFFHPYFISAVLNDFFGIQTRPVCSTALDYSHFLLGFPSDVKNFINNGCELFKPTFTRLYLPYFYPDYVVKYIIKCLDFVRKNAYLFLGLYNYDANTGKFWFYNSKTQPKKIETLFNFFNEGSNEINDQVFEIYDKITEEKLNRNLEKACDYVYSINSNSQIIRDLIAAKNEILPDFRNDEFKIFNRSENSDYEFRWFILCKDVQDEIKMKISNNYDLLEKCVFKKMERNDSFKWEIKV